MKLGPAERTVSAAIAILAWSALALQLWLLIRAAAAKGVSAPQAVVNFLSYFTIECNILVALVTTAAALRLDGGGILARPLVRSAVALYIAAVGLVYMAVLRQLWNPQGLQWIADVVLHNAIPVLYLLYWAIFVPKGALRWRHALWWLSFPLAFLGWSLIHGALTGFYPYPFIDAGALGLGELARNVLLLIAVFWGLGLLLIAIDRAMGRARRPVAGG